jgi:hypothetical protein
MIILLAQFGAALMDEIFVITSQRLRQMTVFHAPVTKVLA